MRGSVRTKGAATTCDEADGEDSRAHQRFPAEPAGTIRGGMRGHSGEELLRLPVRVHGIQLGRPVDVILDGGTRPRAVGFDVLCGDDGHRFLPLAAATVRGDEISVDSTLMLLEDAELRYYHERGRTLRHALGVDVNRSGAPLGELRDLVVAADGTIEAVVVGENGHERRVDFDRDVEVRFARA
jgi:hypothetical protein